MYDIHVSCRDINLYVARDRNKHEGRRLNVELELLLVLPTTIFYFLNLIMVSDPKRKYYIARQSSMFSAIHT
jgi:hypothetical protein